MWLKKHGKYKVRNIEGRRRPKDEVGPEGEERPMDFAFLIKLVARKQRGPSADGTQTLGYY